MKKLIILLLFVYVVCDSFSQDSEFDKIYQPKNGIFSGIQKSKSKYSKGSPNASFLNVVKVCPTLLFRGVIPFYYERAVFNDMSFQVGFGGILFKDAIMQTTAGEEIINANSSYNSDLNIGQLMNISALDKTSTNLFYSLSLKMFSIFDADLFDGTFIELAYRGTNTNFILGNNSYYPIEGRGDFNVRTNAFTVNFGYQTYTDGPIRLSHEFFWGTGLKLVKFNGYSERQGYLPNGDNYTYYSRNSQTTSITIPTIVLGYSLGFGF